MIRTSARIALAVLATVAIAGIARPAVADEDAAKKKALDLYERGTTQYDLGNWDEAVRLFKEAYGTYQAPAFLFNIGQSYRQKAECEQAIFFYKRFLSKKPDTPNRAEVETFIRDLTDDCPRRAAAAPDAQPEPAQADPAVAEPAEPEPAQTEPAPTEPEAAPRVAEVAADGDTAAALTATPSPLLEEAAGPSLVVAQVAAGPAFLGLGDFRTPAQVAVTASAGYPLALGPALLDVGVLGSYTPVFYRDGGIEDSAALSSLLANVGAAWPLTAGLAVRGELGVGALFFSGLERPGHFFLEEDSRATGALSMLRVRVAVGAEYALGDTFLVHAQPIAFGWSPAAAGLREDIESVTDYQLLFGVGMRL